MKAAFLMNDEMHVGDMPDPVPGKGQVLVRTHSCGLCASDAHFLHTGSHVVAKSQEFGGIYSHLDMNKPFVPGHEYVGEIVDYGPGCQRRLKPGTRVTSLPIIRHSDGRDIIGFSHNFPGGFGEYILLDEEALMEIPTALDDDMAAMIEPLAVGLEHARVGNLTPDDIPLVVGCGAIGLGVIAGLKLMGAKPIVAVDFDAGRRDIALRMGADVVVNPGELSPYGPIHELGMRRATLIYECAGAQGLLNEIVRSVGFGAQIVMGGFCLEPEPLYVPCAQMKRLKINFASGEEQQDMDLAMRSIADGTINITPWLGGSVGLSGVERALVNMKNPSAPIRTVVDPRRL